MCKQKYVAWLLFTCWLGLLHGQGFEGRLTVEFSEISIDSTLRERELAFFGADYIDRRSSSKTTYIIKSDKMIGRQLDKQGDLMYEYVQIEPEPYLLTASDKKIKYNSIPMENIAYLKCTYKSPETKMINGYRCRQYEYLTADGNTRIIGWIAESIPFDKKRQYTQFFRQLFLTDGLPLEKRMIYNQVALLAGDCHRFAQNTGCSAEDALVGVMQHPIRIFHACNSAETPTALKTSSV